MNLIPSVLITGATGLVGKLLTGKCIRRNIRVGIVTSGTGRLDADYYQDAEVYTWADIKNKPEILEQFAGIVHLSGANVAGKRWDEKYKKEILESRTETTRVLAEAIKKIEKKPRVFVSASAVGIYGSTGPQPIDERYTQFPDNYLSYVCREWEKSSEEIERMGIRRAIARIGVVLSPEGGALKEMLLPFKLFAGGPLGNGSQWLSWIHIDDVAGILLEMLNNETMSGVYNATSPHPVTMKEFAQTLGKIMHRPAWFPVPEFVMILLKGKEITQVVMASQNHLPARLTAQGYQFRFPYLRDALRSFFNSYKGRKASR